MKDAFDPKAADGLAQDGVIALIAPVGGVEAGEVEAAGDVDLGTVNGLGALIEGGTGVMIGGG